MAKKRVTLKDVVIHYVHANKPTLKFEMSEVPGAPLENKEYVVDACISASRFKQMQKDYKGLGVKSIKEVKELSAEKYEAAYKVAPPVGYENEDGEYFVMKFRAHADFPSGDAAPVPQVVGIVGKTKDRKGEQVKQDTSIGNGSVAFLQYEERPYTFKNKPGISLDLRGLAITDLVEYTAQEMDWDFEEDPNAEEDPFGDDSGAAQSHDDDGGSQEPEGDDEWE